MLRKGRSKCTRLHIELGQDHYKETNTMNTKTMLTTTAILFMFATPAMAFELIDSTNTNTNLNANINSNSPEQTTITKVGAGAASKSGAASESEASSPNNMSNQYKTRANSLGVSLQRNPVHPGRTNPNVFGSPEQVFSFELGPFYSQSRTGPAECMLSGTTAAAAMSLTLAQTVSNYYGMNNPGVSLYWEEASKQVGFAIQNCVKD
jgi:hypothetical protein